MPERLCVGIDLGTTYSLVAVMDGGKPRVVPNSLGEALTPSAVSFDDDGSVLVGTAARARLRTHPERTAISFKRDMGTDKTRRLGAAEPLRPEQLSAMVLEQLRRDAERSLGRPIAEAVVTVPAYFGELQRRGTRVACELAGIHVERIINEPTAAALAYGLHDTEREVRAVVLDLGGGTFDVTVLEIIEGVIEIQASAGDSRLGGDDFVDLLARHCRERIRRLYGAKPVGDRAEQRLWEACERAKQTLTTETEARIALPALPLESGEADVALTLTRDRAEELWGPLLARIASPIRRALRDAQCGAADIEEVLLVGGATRMPCVRNLAATLFGRLPSSVLPPDEAVALGAAVQAALKSGDAAVDDLVVTDVAPFSLGIASASTMGSHMVSGVFSPILERGTVLPASRVQAFSTVSDNQSELRVQVFQGEHSLVADNQKIGEYMVRGIPPARAGEQSVEVRFTYDLNGILEVESTIVATKKRATLVIDHSGGGLSRRELEKAQKAMQRLKFHPRDALPNRTALARADALYAELTGIEREAMAAAIESLRLALEAQDRTAIESSRAFLTSRIDRLRR